MNGISHTPKITIKQMKTNSVFQTPKLLLTLLAVFVVGSWSYAQEIEPPFTWKGNGKASFITEQGVKDISFKIQLVMDENGEVSGKTSNEDGSSAIKHLFYGPVKNYELPGLTSRKAVIVLMMNEDGNEPMIVVLNGKMLSGRNFFGELMIKRYEFGSASDKGLGVGNKNATELFYGNFPATLKSALEKCAPIGSVSMQGVYQK